MKMAGICEMKLKKVKVLTEVLTASGILYLLALMPRMWRRPDTSLFKKKYFAHRGLHDNESEAPENSMAAFCKAVAADYGIEFDVHVTRDGIPVVFHDFKLERICGASGNVEDYTYEELQKFTLCQTEERIPKLEEVLSMVQGRVPLIIEIKSEKADVSECAIIDRVLQRYNGAYCIESFNPIVLCWYRLHRNEIVRGQLASNFRIDGENHSILYFFLTHLLLNFLTGPDFIAYNHRFREEPGRRICRKLYCNPAVAWTVKSREELEEIKCAFDVFIFEGFMP